MEPRTKTCGPIPGALILTHTHLALRLEQVPSLLTRRYLPVAADLKEEARLLPTIGSVAKHGTALPKAPRSQAIQLPGSSPANRSDWSIGDGQNFMQVGLNHPLCSFAVVVTLHTSMVDCDVDCEVSQPLRHVLTKLQQGAALM